MTPLKKQLLAIYALSALFSGGRLLVGAISVLYVMSHGISISEFATIKSIQVLTFLILDIPTGLLIKRIGYRKSLFIMFICSISGLSLYVLGNGFYSFAIAEFLTAISLCICPAVFVDYIMDVIDQNPNLVIERIFHENDMYTSLANVFCGAIGGYIYTYTQNAPYIAGALIQILGLYLILNIPEAIANKETQKTISLISLRKVFLV